MRGGFKLTIDGSSNGSLFGERHAETVDDVVTDENDGENPKWDDVLIN